MISEQVIKEAAERYAKWRHGKRSSSYDSPYFNCDGDDPGLIREDRTVLADAYIEQLARRDWQGEPSGEGWYWCEELDADAPPQKIDRNGDGKFRRWTVAGWLDLNGRVCKIMERPA